MVDEMNIRNECEESQGARSSRRDINVNEADKTWHSTLIRPHAILHRLEHDRRTKNWLLPLRASFLVFD